MGRDPKRPSGYRPRFTARRRKAAIAAIAAMLAGEEGEGDWPPEVTAADLHGALEAIEALNDRWTTGKERS